MSGSILVTGANRGIGLELSRRFVERGWRVIATCRQPETAAELATLARSQPAACEIRPLEVRDAASVAALGAWLERRREPLDVLVNNAGINPEPRDRPVADVPVDLVAAALDVNLLGALRMLQAALPALRRSERPRVVNVSSGAGSLAHNSATRPQPAYCISKAALNMLTRCAARDLPGMIVVSVSPGWIRTDMGGAAAELGPREATTALANTIDALRAEQTGGWLDRFGRPSSYAW
jgi:NAD(P)-dependent dehydrogenase (short-subunit alcohol dehydrogenase family)